MINLKKLAVAVAIAGPSFLLSACGTYNVDGIAAMPNKGDAFAQALQKRYIERARFEIGEQDWRSVDFFAARAEMAAGGSAPLPQPPVQRGLKVDVDQIKAGHDKLVAGLNAGAQKKEPDACALAQTWLEHWMEQSEEGWQTDHIAQARKGFEENIPKCVAAPAPAPAPVVTPAPAPAPKIVKTFIVYFDYDKAVLTPESLKTLKEVSDSYKQVMPLTVSLSGHTDTMGANAYNQKLSDRRVKAVGDELSKMGIKSKALDAKAFGEAKLAEATADNVKSQKNRRVEIYFEK